MKVPSLFNFLSISSIDRSLMHTRAFTTSRHCWNLDEVHLANDFFNLIGASDGRGKSYKEWSGNIVKFTLEAGAESLSLIAKALQAFCERISCMSKPFEDRLLGLGTATSSLLTCAREVVQTCVPGILKGLEKTLEGQLLRSEEFFQQEASSVFLPEVTKDSEAFLGQCLVFCSASSADSLKDTLVSMSTALSKEKCEDSGFDLSDILAKYHEHELQALCCLCTDSMYHGNGTLEISELKSKVATVEEALKSICAILKNSVHFAWFANAKAWVATHVVGKLMGDFLALVTSKVTKAIEAQPEGLEMLLVNRNVARLRQLVFFQRCAHGSHRWSGGLSLDRQIP